MSVVRELDSIGYLVPADAGPKPIDPSGPWRTRRSQTRRRSWTRERPRSWRRPGSSSGRRRWGYVRKDGRLYEHPKLGKVIRKACRIAAREGIHAAMAYLREQVPVRPALGKRKQGLGPWTTDSTRKLLRSRVYLGESWSGTLHGDDAHGQLTMLGDWTAVRTAPRERGPNDTYPLSGIAGCERCGEALHGQLQTVRSGNAFRRYRCSNR